jgi:hypothetical protein
MEESAFDPIWTEGESKEDMVDILNDFNGSFEDDLEFWRFFEVPNSLGSTTEIIKGDVVHGAKAAKVTYEAATPALGDRALDNWDANMPLEEGAEYFAEFWAKTTTPGTGSLRVTYGFFDENRQVISEESMWLDITSDYKKYEFSFIAPEGTALGWLSFRWKDKVEDEFASGVVILDHIQLWTLDKTVGINDLITINTDKAVLKQNYPNPFSASTTISYALSEKSDIELSVYNFHGQKVEVLLQQKMSAGSYQTVWNPKNLGGGIYFIALRTDTEVLTKKMTISK